MSLYTCQSHNNVTTHLLITGKHHCILFTIALPLQGCSIATVLAVPPHAVLTNCVLRPVNHYCYIKVTVQTSAKLVTCSMGTFSSSSMACFRVLSTPSIRFWNASGTCMTTTHGIGGRFVTLFPLHWRLHSQLQWDTTLISSWHLHNKPRPEAGLSPYFHHTAYFTTLYCHTNILPNTGYQYTTTKSG